MSDVTTELPAFSAGTGGSPRTAGLLLTLAGGAVWIAMLLLAAVPVLGLDVPEPVALLVVLATVALSALSLPAIVRVGRDGDHRGDR